MSTAKVHKITPELSTRTDYRYEILFEEAFDPIITMSKGPHGLKIDSLNRSAEEMTGYMRNELVEHPVSSLTPGAGGSHVPARCRPLTEELLTASGTYEDIAIARKDGFIRIVDVSYRVLKGFAVVILRDVTEKKRMERELITKHTELRDAYTQLEKKTTELQSMQETLVQAGKMAALGELAAGIAHEINQPLQGIKGFAQELQSGALDPTSTREALGEIITAADKMAKIISYLRTWVRKSTEDHDWVDIHAPVGDAIKLVGRQFETRGIKIHHETDTPISKVYANPMQLEQVFINLSTNARDAIEATGRGAGNLWIRAREDGPFVEVEFKDDGCGMDERTRAKVFNPFFTTKEVGKGMGLGMSLSYGILSKINGSIVVESELGKGTSFKVRIPKDFRSS